MAGRGKRGVVAELMPAPLPVRRSGRAATPVPNQRAATPIPNQRAPTPRPRSRASTPMPNQRTSTPRQYSRSSTRCSTPMPQSRSSTPMPGARALKTVETQTPTLSKRPLQPPPSKLSPYVMRSDPSASLLRNGKQQRTRNNSLLLDGIPIVKRTRSLISDSETSSIKSGVFNDTSSMIDGYFNLPDSPLETKHHNFLPPDIFPAIGTPRRSRNRRMSEASNVTIGESPTRKNVLAEEARKLLENPVKKEKLDGKRKRGQNSTAATEPAKKKLKKTQVKKEKAPQSTKVVAKKKAVATKVAPGNKKNIKTDRKKKLIPTGSVRRRGGVQKKVVLANKIKKQQLARKIIKSTKGNTIRAGAKNASTLRAKTVVGTKKVTKVKAPVDKQPNITEKKADVKSDENSLPKKKQTERETDNAENVLSKDISIQKNKLVPPKKVIKPVKRKPKVELLHSDADTFNTLSQVSQILKKLVDSKEVEEEEKLDEPEEMESAPRTPELLLSKPVSNPPSSEASMMAAVNCDESKSQTSSTHVSPLNNLASKLRRKLSQSPTIESPAAGGQMLPPRKFTPRGVVTVPVQPVIRNPLPIINSLSAAAKQTSSFLRKPEEPELPSLTKKDSQYKLNKTLIYHKISNLKESLIPNNRLSTAVKGTMTSIFKNKSPMVTTEHKPLPVKALFTESTNVATPLSQNGVISAAKAQEAVQALDNNENKLLTKSNHTTPEKNTLLNEKRDTVTVKSDKAEVKITKKDGPVSMITMATQTLPTATATVTATTSHTSIPEKDKPIDNHSELVTIPNKTERTVLANLRSTDGSIQVQPDSQDSDTSNLTPNSESPIDKPDDPVASLPSKDEVQNTKSLENTEVIPPESVSLPTVPPIPPCLAEVASRVPSLPFEEEEDMAAKVSVLEALGLRSNQALSEQAKAPKVPKLRLVCRPTLKKHRRSANDPCTSGYKEKTYTVCREGDSVDWDRPSPTKSSKESNIDTGTRSLQWIPRMPISNGKSMENLADINLPEPGVGVGDGLGNDNTEGGEKSSESLVIPEKSSSFAIHPGRLCEDVCSLCHNKFGLYDTPLHVAQLKGDEKQSAVLARESLLTLESCLCDACFRHLDRPVPPRGPKPPTVKQKPLPNQICSFKDCYQLAAHSMMRKWKRRVRSLLREDQQDPKCPNWVCEAHYSELARIGVCGLCQRRLSSQQMYKLESSAVPRLNKLIRYDRIPVTLDDSMSLCKKCRYYASLRLRSEDHMKLNSNNRIFLKEHRNRVLKSQNVDPASVPDVFMEQEKPKKQPKKKGSPTQEANATPTPPGPPTPTSNGSRNSPAPNKLPKQKLRVKLNSPTPATPPPPPRKMPTNARMSTGTPRIVLQPKMTPSMQSKSPNQPKTSPTSTAGIRLPSQTKITIQPRPIAPAPPKVNLPAIQISPIHPRLPTDKGDLRRVATQNASSSTLLSRMGLTKYSTTITSVSQTPQVTIVPVSSARPSTSQASTSRLSYSTPANKAPANKAPANKEPKSFPTSTEVAMTSNFVFQPTDDKSTWQKVNATFQFDRKTREMWNNLHAPYGSYTSFLRHLVLLENHWRTGDLVLSSNASVRARQYLNSVQNRIQAYESVPSEPDAVPQISDVRSLATGSGNGSWGTNPSTSM